MPPSPEQADRCGDKNAVSYIKLKVTMPGSPQTTSACRVTAKTQNSVHHRLWPSNSVYRCNNHLNAKVDMLNSVLRAALFSPHCTAHQTARFTVACPARCRCDEPNAATEHWIGHGSFSCACLLSTGWLTQWHTLNPFKASKQQSHLLYQIDHRRGGCHGLFTPNPESMHPHHGSRHQATRVRSLPFCGTPLYGRSANSRSQVLLRAVDTCAVRCLGCRRAGLPSLC